MSRMRRFCCAFWLGAAVLGFALHPTSAADTLPGSQADDRIARLENFFRAYHCPAPLLAAEYLAAADAYEVDYRLLPAVSVRESTCGRYARRNNRWGWDSAQTGFRTLAHGIQFITHQLAFGQYYRGKTLEEKLRMYNPNPTYPAEIKKLMREIQSD